MTTPLGAPGGVRAALADRTTLAGAAIAHAADEHGCPRAARCDEGAGPRSRPARPAWTSGAPPTPRRGPPPLGRSGEPRDTDAPSASTCSWAGRSPTARQPPRRCSRRASIRSTRTCSAAPHARCGERRAALARAGRPRRPARRLRRVLGAAGAEAPRLQPPSQAADRLRRPGQLGPGGRTRSARHSQRLAKGPVARSCKCLTQGACDPGLRLRAPPSTRRPRARTSRCHLREVADHDRHAGRDVLEDLVRAARAGGSRRCPGAARRRRRRRRCARAARSSGTDGQEVHVARRPPQSPRRPSS